MGGDGYALLRAESEAPRAQLRSMVNLVRADLLWRSPGKIGDGDNSCCA